MRARCKKHATIKNLKPVFPKIDSDILENPELALIKHMGSFSGSIYKWVLFSFPWGEKGTELEKHEGPDEWQTRVLKDIDAGLLTPGQAIQIAIASGHGIGKSALVAWIILWSLSTFEDTRGVVTANTGTQLLTKTWPELAKWYRLFIAKHWFVFTATSIYSSQRDHEKTWRIDMITWSENNTEAFAGLHNQGKRVVLLFDEASAIADKIWEVSEGALTDKDTEIIWACFGNPTQNVGRFYDCFNKYRHRWKTEHIDSRTARMSNKEQITKWAEDYGEDSDWFKVRVRGEFPNTSDHQFIPTDIVELARGRHLRPDQFNFAPKIIALDNAWTGGDEIVIGMRQGLCYKILATFAKNDDDNVIAGHLARFEDQEQADAVLIDLGWGTGVQSMGKQLGRNWILIPFGGASTDHGYLNLIADCWNKMKRWLREGGAIPNDPVLVRQLTTREAYTITNGKHIGKIKLESKDDLKARGQESPGRVDPLAMTFAIDVKAKDKYEAYRNKDIEKIYDPFKELNQPAISADKTYDALR